MKSFALAFLCFLGFALNAEPCARSLSSADALSSYYISYLEALIGQGVLTRDHLRLLAQSPLENPLTQESGAIARIHAREIAYDIARAGISADEVSRWAWTKVQTMTHQRDGRARVTEDTRNLGMRLVTVEGRGKLQSFELQSTLVTQRTWVAIMGNNPAYFQGELDAPIEMISWASAIEFANRLSLAERLSPVYEWDGDLLITHIDRTGYRLPTKHEMLFVLSDRGRHRGPLFPGVNYSNVDKYVWSEGNSGRRTQAVASLMPFRIDDGEFFDLIGNVFVWCANGESAGRAGFSTPRAWIGQRMGMTSKPGPIASSLIGIRLARSLP